MIDAYLRTVTKEDCDTIFQWANEPLCRQNSLHSEPIDYNTHIQWFDQKLKDELCKFYIMCIKNTEVGTIRLQIEETVATISYSIKQECQGKGYGTLMLQLAEKEAEMIEQIQYLKGIVKYGNTASQKIFLKLGYQERTKADVLIYEKKIRGE